MQVYDYNQVVSDVVDVHYPITEMACASKISCVAWNPYHKNELASSDYEGTVTMWDPFTGKKTHMYQVGVGNTADMTDSPILDIVIKHLGHLHLVVHQ